MGRPAVDFNCEPTGSLPCGFDATTRRRWFQHENCSGILCLRFDQRTAAGAAALFVTSQKYCHGRLRARFSCLAGAQSFQREREVCFHVKNSRTINSIAFGAPRPLFDGAAWMNRIGVTKNYNRRRLILSGESANPHVLAKILTRDSLNRIDGANTAGGAGQQRYDGTTTVLITRGRFGFNQSTSQCQQLMLTRDKMIA